jgi:hypothetical protein
MFLLPSTRPFRILSTGGRTTSAYAVDPGVMDRSGSPDHLQALPQGQPKKRFADSRRLPNQAPPEFARKHSGSVSLPGLGLVLL